MDKLKSYKNVMVLGTSNLTSAIDSAFFDRADATFFVGLPTPRACYNILQTCLSELRNKGVLAMEAIYSYDHVVDTSMSDTDESMKNSCALLEFVNSVHGEYSARFIRKKAVQALSTLPVLPCSLQDYISALDKVVKENAK